MILNIHLVAHVTAHERIGQAARHDVAVVVLCPMLHARIIGVPFNTFKGGQTVVTKPQKPKAIIRALPERQQMEIRFPVITGYRSDNIEGALTADFTDLPKFQLNFNQIPTENILQTIVNGDHEEISAVLNYYNPEGSTIHVYRPTNKTVYPTQKSHVNYVIAEDNSWQQIAANNHKEYSMVFRL